METPPPLLHKEKTHSPPRREAIMDLDGSAWDQRSAEIISHYTHIITLRGAGSNNGIDKEAADKLLCSQLLPRIKSRLEDGPVVIMFDGDQDSLEKPDIGYVLGRLRDEFAGESEEKILFIAAQKKSWYYPSQPGSNLTNANNLEYETFVFDDNTFPGDHNRFTQSEQLVNAPGYEQWYIGASGPIAAEQLEDFDSKVKQGSKGKAVIFRAPINADLETGIQEKLDQARFHNESQKIENLSTIINQRRERFGIHWNTEGNPLISGEKFAHIDVEFVAE
jgi:hypothetical protein